MKKTENANRQLEIVIKNDGLKSLVKDYAELVVDGIMVDGIMVDGILKEIPLVGTVIGMIKFSNTVSRQITIKKLYKFLHQLNAIPIELRTKKVDEINNSKKYQSTVGEMILEHLDRIESDGKPEIIGKLFRAVIEEKINYQIYLKLCHIVKNTFYWDLIDLKSITKRNYVIGPVDDGIFSSGLVTTDFAAQMIEEDKKETYTTLTELGQLLIHIGME